MGFTPCGAAHLRAKPLNRQWFLLERLSMANDFGDRAVNPIGHAVLSGSKSVLLSISRVGE